jgi:DUF4097 and DUF4098 domain-containing protein YvlB
MMAGYPPPPYSAPPPPGAPFGGPNGWDPRDQRRAWREQNRAQARMQRDAFKAQREAFRAQRDLYRQQTRVARRGSILGPLVLVAAGVLALLVSIRRLPAERLMTWYSRWWPLAIVAVGLVVLAEWGVDQWIAHRAAEEGRPTPPMRRTLGAGTVFLVILLGLIGVSAQGFREGVNTFTTTTNNFGITSGDLQELFGEKYQRGQEIDQPFAPGGSLLINNPHGDVIITGQSGNGQIHITVNKQFYSPSASQAESKAAQLSPQVSQDGSTLSVTLPSLSGGVSDVTISLPDFAQVTANASHGDVHVSGMHGLVKVSATHGDVELNGLGATAVINMGNNNSSLQAHNIAGDLTLKGRADDLSITDVAGQVSLEGEFFGDAHLARLRGPMVFETNRTHFSVARLDGEADISPDSDLSGSDILGPTELRTRSRNISLERVAGAVDVANTNGSVDLTSALPFGNVTIDNRNGAVNLTVPEHAGMTIDADAQGGSIDNDLNLHATSDNNNSQLRGQTGNGGNRVSIHTTHDDINIKQALVTSKPMQPNVPLPPASPAAPKPPVKAAAVRKEKTPVTNTQEF